MAHGLSPHRARRDWLTRILAVAQVGEGTLGHTRPKLLRAYMPTLPLGEAREALQMWGEELTRILGVVHVGQGTLA